MTACPLEAAESAVDFCTVHAKLSLERAQGTLLEACGFNPETLNPKPQTLNPDP